MSGHPVNDDALNGNKTEITPDAARIRAKLQKRVQKQQQQLQQQQQQLQQLLQQLPPQRECITRQGVRPMEGH